MSGRGPLRSGNRVDGRHVRDERNHAGTIDRAGRRVAALAIMLTALLSLVQVSAAQAEPKPIGVPGSWGLRLNEEFSGSSLNAALWTPGWHHSGISGPVSGDCLSSENVSQNGNGYLYLQLRKVSPNDNCESEGQKASQSIIGGMVESDPGDGHGGFSYKEGYVEWRMSIPGVGAEGCPKGGCLPDWPALWSLPENHESEIDTLEGLGTLGQACFHLPPPFGSEAPGQCLVGSSYAGWHTYGARWEGSTVTWYYDGVEVGQLSSSHLVQPHYLVMNIINPTHGEPLVVPNEMTVDYVRVWQHPVAPSVTTGAATGVQPLQATLNGEVNPNAWETHYYFKYGTSTSYGSTTGEVDAGAGAGVVPASATPTGLSPGTTYHYRLVAKNSVGETVEGSDHEFKTPGPVEAATSGASGTLAEQGIVNGTVDPRGYDAKYYFEYGETSSYGHATAEADAGAGESPIPVAITVNELKPATSYHYRIVATSGGVTSRGEDRIFRTNGQRGVSCVSSSFCMSVGTYDVGQYSYTLGEKGTSAGWAIVSTYLPPSAIHSELDGVSCTSSSFCMAVGTYSTGQYSYTLGEEWNGKEWANIGTFFPPSATRSELNGVSCTSSSFCMAVGTYSTGQYSYTLGEEWNGKEWANIGTYFPPSATHTSLKGVRCTSTTFCMATGSYSTGTGQYSYTLGEEWNGKEWVNITTFIPKTAVNSELDAVSCTATTFCMATGTYSTGQYSYTLGEEWNGKEWANITTFFPGTAVQSELNGVSCTSSIFCMAVGTYSTGQYSYTLGNAWNGTEWSNVTTFFPRESAVHSSLAGASCTSTTFCMAMGTYSTGQYSYPLGNEWTGEGQWVNVSAAYPSGAEHTEL
jgi:uncharacterized protein YktA (UPF0223 family)